MIERDEAVARGLGIIGRGKLLVEELEWLYDLAKRAPEGSAVEVGPLCGRSLVAWAYAREGRGTIYAVDNVIRDCLAKNIAALAFPITLICKESWEATTEIPDSLAFCFIDADHGIDGFPKDILPWAAKMIPGGIIVYHDYDVWKPTVVVKRYVDALQSLVGWKDLGAVRSAKAF